MSVGGLVVSTHDTGGSVKIVTRAGGAGLETFLGRSFAARSISPGATIRWHGGNAYWTPRGKPFADFKIPRLCVSRRTSTTTR